MSEEYDLKKSEETIGQLYPILTAKDGEVIDGFHREEADGNWKRVKLEHIDTEEKKLLARLIANFHRRAVSAEEKAEWINGLAEIYRKQGLQVRKEIGSTRINEIISKISETVGLEVHTVRNYISPEYKMTEATRVEPQEPRLDAATRIEHTLGKAYVERHREEVLAEETPKIKAQVKRELLKDPESRRELIRELSKPLIVKLTEPCPSGVCELAPELPSMETKPIDVMAERIEKFWKDNPQCRCKGCENYGKCGVIR